MSKERWDSVQGKRVENRKVDAFLDEVVAVCKKHGFSIRHEDDQGGFIVTGYGKDSVDWLMDASVDMSEEVIPSEPFAKAMYYSRVLSASSISIVGPSTS